MHMKKQAGGTLVGFIVGLIVGLGVALAVAVYITKVPAPFVDRGVQRKPDQEAIEKERNRDWNPNATLGGKPVAAPSPDATAPAPDATAVAPAPAPAPAQAPATGKGDPLGELIQSRTATSPGQVPTVEAAPQPDPFVYYVQAGAFRGPDEAEAQRARLAMLGFDARITEREQAGKPVFRVRIGPFEKKVEADVMQERLNGQNVENTLVRVQR
ncbi:SPOR domain-containing protein [Hydrogenophaga aquatica]